MFKIYWLQRQSHRFFLFIFFSFSWHSWQNFLIHSIKRSISLCRFGFFNGNTSVESPWIKVFTNRITWMFVPFSNSRIKNHIKFQLINLFIIRFRAVLINCNSVLLLQKDKKIIENISLSILQIRNSHKSQFQCVVKFGRKKF